MVPLTAERNQRNVLLLTGVGHFAAHFFELMFPTLAVALAREARVPIDQVWTWSFAGYLAFGLGALPASLVAERVSARLLLLVSLFGVGVSALAASEVTSPRALTVCLALMGATASIYHPAASGLIARTLDHRGRALGIIGIFGAGAVALTPVLTAALCARFGWQDAFRVIGYAMCALAVGCAFLPVREPPRRVAAAATPETPIAWHPLLVLLVAAALAGVSYRGNTLVQPAYVALHVSPVWFGAAVSAAYTLGLGGQYVGARLADRHALHRPYLAFHLVSLPALILMTMLSGAPLVLCAAVFVFCSLATQPLQDGRVAQAVPARRRPAIRGLALLCTFGVGSLAIWLVRWADGVGGLGYAILCLAGVVTLVALAATVLLRMEGASTARTLAHAPAEVRGGAHPQPGSPLLP
ncbi:MAG: MFS transporter [Candidatus Binatia bacterium]